MDNLLTAHVRGYEVIHRIRPDAVVTTNNSVHERLRLRPDADRSAAGPQPGVERDDVDAVAGRSAAASTTPLLPPSGAAERLSARLGAGHGARTGRRAAPAAERAGPGPVVHRRPPVPRRAVDAVYDSPHERTLDVLGLDYYDPMVVPALPPARPPHRRGTEPPARPASCGTTCPTRPGSPGGCGPSRT